MSYCFNQRWISDYHFARALEFRTVDDGAVDAQSTAPAPATSLLLWGGVDPNGVPFLEPAFVVDAPPALPPSGGHYRLSARSDTGAELFTLAFDMPEVAHGDGASSFAFALPMQPDWAGSLSSITLSGPGGSATLDHHTDRPMTILPRSADRPRAGVPEGSVDRDAEPAGCYLFGTRIRS